MFDLFMNYVLCVIFVNKALVFISVSILISIAIKAITMSIL